MNLFGMLKMLGLYIIVLSQCSADPLLDGLYGVRGANKVTICMTPGGACDGALWSQHWVITRNSCLQEADMSDLNIWKGEVNCSNVGEENMLSSQNTAVIRYQPSNMDDVALLRLNWPYPTGDPITNQTSGELLTKLKLYVNEINEAQAVKTTRKGNEMYYNYQYVKNNSSPIKIFLLTVILPSAAFMVFFFFIIFFTGSNKGRVSYRPLQIP